MAKIVEFGLLEPGATYWQEFLCGSYVIPCKVLSRADESHVMMRFGTECPWVQDVKADPCFRYWDDIPTDKDSQGMLWLRRVRDEEILL